MKTKILLIGGIAAATLFAGGWAVAQTQGHGHGASHAQHGTGHGQMQHQGHGQKQHMGHGERQNLTQGGPGARRPADRGTTGNAHQH